MSKADQPQEEKYVSEVRRSSLGTTRMKIKLKKLLIRMAGFTVVMLESFYPLEQLRLSTERRTSLSFLKENTSPPKRLRTSTLKSRESKKSSSMETHSNVTVWPWLYPRKNMSKSLQPLWVPLEPMKSIAKTRKLFFIISRTFKPR